MIGVKAVHPVRGKTMKPTSTSRIVAYGTAKVTIDGFITGAHWDNRGVMGTGVVGGSEDTVGPGDLVFVFRNTAHFFDPISSKFGYLLVDLPQSEPFWPKSIIPNGTGAY